MPSPLIKNAQGFDFGFTSITTMNEQEHCGMNVSILKLKAEEHYDVNFSLECALLLLSGDVAVDVDGKKLRGQRENFFDETPFAIHLAPNDSAKITAITDSEFFVVTTDNDQQFASTVFDKTNILENEHRGKGLLEDSAYRIVRTVFDKRNRPSSNLVLGEVITFPGRWSSYPPHHHVQPEIYHYRFTEAQGYGHAELGDDVFKIRNFDTLKILEQKTHSQVSAPGYGMFYVWAIRHLEGAPYGMPTFVDEHAWTKEHGADERVWKMRTFQT